MGIFDGFMNQKNGGGNTISKGISNKNNNNNGNNNNNINNNGDNNKLMTKTKNTKLSIEEEKKIEKENNLLLNQYLNIVEKINDLEESIEKLSDEELCEKR